MRTLKKVILILLLVPLLGILVQPHCSVLVASYLYPFALLLFPLSIIYILICIVSFYKKNKWRWIFFLAVSLSLILVTFTYQIDFSNHQKQTEKSFKLLSWNVDNFKLSKDRLKDFAIHIKDKNIDIMCLQERPHDVLLSWDTICSVLNYPYQIKNSREDEVLNLAVLSRWPLSNLKEYYFPDSYNKFFQIDIQNPNGSIRLFNVHLQTTGTSDFVQGNLLKVFQQNAFYRNTQADLLSDLIRQSPYPVIVCGDFNDLPLSYSYSKVHNQLKDCFREAGSGWGGTFQPLGNLFRIDYIFCSYSLDVNSYQLIKNGWSDHEIQVAEIQFD